MLGDAANIWDGTGRRWGQGSGETVPQAFVIQERVAGGGIVWLSGGTGPGLPRRRRGQGGRTTKATPWFGLRVMMVTEEETTRMLLFTLVILVMHCP